MYNDNYSLAELLGELKQLLGVTVGTPLEGDEDLTALFSFAEVQAIIKALNKK